MLKSQNILLIMRHAQSDLPNYHDRDFDRPLDSWGEEQAPEIALELNALDLTIQQALVSPARRTLQTFELLTQKLEHQPAVCFDPRLYRASFSDIINILLEHAESYSSILLIGHNPSVSELSYQLTREFYDFQPGSVAILRALKKNLVASLESNSGFCLEKFLSPRGPTPK